MLEVKPSMIRVEADEVTYNLHVMMRFDLERAVVSGDLTLAELPAAWNERFEHDFGLVPASDAEGVLQDIHWSAGLVGYFPTYTLGNIYAAELMAAAEHDLPNLRAGFAAGQFAELLHWLSERVHKHGRQQTSDALVEQAIGRPPAETALLESLRRRYGPAYGLS
jgi:carboxypeptidase Taq